MIERFLEQDPKALLINGRTYGEIYKEALRISGYLIERTKLGEPVMLLFSDQAPFLEAFFGTLLAGCVAVPLFPKNEAFIQKSAKECGARIFLAEGIAVHGPEKTRISDAHPMIFQYTSGSTADPSKIVISYENVRANLEMLKQKASLTKNDIFAGWLPPYHDMGLIGMLLLPIYLGAPVWTITPQQFTKEPAAWTRLIYDKKATVTIAPNFAYQLTADKAEPIDLSCLEVAFIGAEPIFEETLLAFSSKFLVPKEAFNPGYGLAEATLMVSASERGSGYKISKGVVSSGSPCANEDVRIENGEIVVSGPNVTKEPLYTGDLGFIKDGELYVTGRKKDLLIVRGQNIYPQDLERISYNASPNCKKGRAAAFSVPGRGTEEIVILQEAKGPLPNIAELIAGKLNVYLKEVVAIEEGQLPLTTSGKVRRQIAKQLFLEGKIKKYAPFVPIAIIGIGYRFPGGELFWNQEQITEPPAGRDPMLRPGGYLEGIEEFDSKRFNIIEEEARWMDPQHRICLEVVYDALENRVPQAVYVGITSHDYFALLVKEGLFSPYSAVNVSGSGLAGRIAKVFGSRGPAEAIDTACSSSIAAIYEACCCLHRGEASSAIVAAVNVMLLPETTEMLHKAGVLSPTGVCRPFDTEADGYVRGEGACALFLKPLAQAKKEDDPILGIIRGVAINQSSANEHLMAPDPTAQTAVIKKALSEAGLNPYDLDYLESHGTGTIEGDKAEIEALSQVFKKPLPIGSVKTNIGHLEACAGMAGIVKTLLSMQHHLLPPHPTLRNPITETFPIPVKATAWDGKLAGVSSFGYAGTNGFLIIEKGEMPIPPAVERRGKRLWIDALSKGLKGYEAVLSDAPLRKQRGEKPPIAGPRGAIQLTTCYREDAEYEILKAASDSIALDFTPWATVSFNSEMAEMALMNFLGALQALPTNGRLVLITKKSPTLAALFGLMRTARMEMPAAFLHHAEVENEGQIQEELVAKHADDIVYRQGKRLAFRLLEVSLNKKITIDPNASYLITGGAGALAKQFARKLAPAHVVLASRRLGIDISDPKQVESLMRRFGDDLPPLKGIIHAAGSLDDHALKDLRASHFSEVFAGKVKGAQNLVRYLPERLDFFWLFSSAASLFGSPGQGNYAAANAFLDGLAHDLYTKGAPATSINWGPWDKIGMAAAAPITAMRPLDPEVAAEAAFHLPQVPQVALCDILWEKIPETLPIAKTLLSNLLVQKKQMPPDDLPTFVHSMIEKRMGRSISPQDNLFVLGLDSLSAAAIRQDLQDALGRPIPISLFADFPTIWQIIHYLSKHPPIGD